MPTSAALRAQARESLRGNWFAAILTTLLLYAVFFVLGLINMIPVIGWLADLFLAGPLIFGLYAYFQDFARNRIPDVSVAFSGFKQFIDVFLLYLLISIFTYLWTLLLVIPGIIAALRYSQAYYILRDNPEIGALEALRRSKQMMAGHKGRLFVLGLTFIGWAILAAIPFGIGYLWLAPYVLTTLAKFHEDLKGRSFAHMPPPPPPPMPGRPPFQP
ncbi:DUF975 family protein [Cohnella sp. REN36]|uniref:DUF975 family protein n=1 Tax=Cohnella sp. REN36 TaxID=2887347 RepID=UPI001D151FAC|nr:DUF975 family protein [Cohnella sp. REN36]MCC3375013.1 DUF975 family protein [Cohnella sp. REN36]